MEQALAALAPAGSGFVSLTGCEPLLQPEAVGEVAKRGRALGLRSYLETHGLAVDALRSVVDQIDVVSMDWKLASDVVVADVAHPVDFDASHAKFLAAASVADEVFVKVVVTPNTLDAELDAMCHAIAATAPESLLVLQPVTPFAKLRERPSAERILAWQRRCARWLEHVRVIPQTHRTYDAL